MKLRSWRQARNLSQAEVAEGLTQMTGVKCHQSSVHRWESGGIPRRRWLVHLKAFTLGEVTADDFV